MFFWENLIALKQLKINFIKDFLLKPNLITFKLEFLFLSNNLPSPESEPRMNSPLSPAAESLERLCSAPPISLEENKINV